MQIAKLAIVQAAIIANARSHSDKNERQQIKREVFSVAKAKFGIPQDTKCKVETDASLRDYLILKDKQGRAFQLGDDGKFNGTTVTMDQVFPPMPTAPVQEAASSTSFPAVDGGTAGQGAQLTGITGVLPAGVTISASEGRIVIVTPHDDINNSWDIDHDGNGVFVLTKD